MKVDIRNKHQPTERKIEISGMNVISVEKYGLERLLVLSDDACCGNCIFMNIIDISQPSKSKVVAKFIKKNEWVHDSLMVENYVFFLGEKGLSVYRLKFFDLGYNK